MWKEGISHQRFFEYIPWKVYFEVRKQVEEEDQDGGKEELFNRVLEERIRRSDEVRKKREIEGNSSRYQPNAWLDFTGWEDHLKGFEKESILSTIRPASDEVREKVDDGPLLESDEEDAEQDRGLAVACQATRRLIRKAIYICQPGIVGRSALMYVNRRETGEADNERPFYAKQKVNTIRKYIDVWLKILRYIWRTSDLEKESRPGYELTSKQERYLRMVKKTAEITESKEKGDSRGREEVGSQRRELEEEEKKKRQEYIERRLLQFYIAMFDHHYKDTEYINGVISALAVLGLDTDNKGWAPAENFTPKLSAIVTVMRSMVLYAGHTHRVHAIESHISEGFDRREAEKRAPSVFDTVQNLVNRFMTLTSFSGKPSPMDTVLHMRTYGMKIRYTTKGEARISWQGERICIDKISFTIGDIRAVVHGLHETAKDTLVKDLLLIEGDREAEIPKFDLHRLFDNAAEMGEGWNFIQDPRNMWSVNGERWMWDRLSRDTSVERKFVIGDLRNVRHRDGIVWNEKSVEDYFRAVKRFKEELFILVHLTGGAPARGTEIVSIQHENGNDSRTQRGIFIDKGMVQFVTSYHKGYSTSQKVKIIHRFIPKEVGELVVRYLWLVEPFTRQLRIVARGESISDCSPFMWQPAPEEEWEEEEDGVEEEEEDTSVNPEVEEPGGEGEIRNNVQNSQFSGITISKKSPTNIDGFWDTDRVRRVITKQTQSRIGVKITTAIWRQVYPAIQREFTKDKEVVQKLEEIYNSGRNPAQHQDDDFQARQSGHGKRMEEMMYGSLLSESPFYTTSEKDGFRKVSSDWHRFLQFESA